MRMKEQRYHSYMSSGGIPHKENFSRIHMKKIRLWQLLNFVPFKQIILFNFRTSIMVKGNHDDPGHQILNLIKFIIAKRRIEITDNGAQRRSMSANYDIAVQISLYNPIQSPDISFLHFTSLRDSPAGSL